MGAGNLRWLIWSSLLMGSSPSVLLGVPDLCGHVFRAAGIHESSIPADASSAALLQLPSDLASDAGVREIAEGSFKLLIQKIELESKNFAIQDPEVLAKVRSRLLKLADQQIEVALRERKNEIDLLYSRAENVRLQLEALPSGLSEARKALERERSQIGNQKTSLMREMRRSIYESLPVTSVFAEESMKFLNGRKDSISSLHQDGGAFYDEVFVAFARRVRTRLEALGVPAEEMDRLVIAQVRVGERLVSQKIEAEIRKALSENKMKELFENRAVINRIVTPSIAVLANLRAIEWPYYSEKFTNAVNSLNSAALKAALPLIVRRLEQRFDSLSAEDKSIPKNEWIANQLEVSSLVFPHLLQAISEYEGSTLERRRVLVDAVSAWTLLSFETDLRQVEAVLKSLSPQDLLKVLSSSEHLIQSIKVYQNHNFGGQAPNHQEILLAALRSLVAEVQSPSSSEGSAVARVMEDLARGQVESDLPEPVKIWVDSLADSFEKELALEFYPQVQLWVSQRVAASNLSDDAKIELEKNLLSKTLLPFQQITKRESEQRESLSTNRAFQRARILEYMSLRLPLEAVELDALPPRWKALRESDPDLFDQAYIFSFMAYLRSTQTYAELDPRRHFLTQGYESFKGAFEATREARGALGRERDVLARTAQLVNQSFNDRWEKRNLRDALHDQIERDIDDSLEVITRGKVDTGSAGTAQLESGAKALGESAVEEVNTSSIYIDLEVGNQMAKAYLESPTPELQSQILELHLSEIANIAKRTLGWSSGSKLISSEDLAAEGAIVFLKILDTFDPEKGDFSPWAMMKVRLGMLDYLRSMDHESRGVRKAVKEREEAELAYYHRYGGFPNEGELEVYLDEDHRLAPEEIQRILRLSDRSTRIGSIEKVNSITGQDFTEDPVVSDTEDFNRDLDYQDLLDRLTAGFPRRDKLIFKLHLAGLTMREIAEVVGISKSYAQSLLEGMKLVLRARASNNPEWFGGDSEFLIPLLQSSERESVVSDEN